MKRTDWKKIIAIDVDRLHEHQLTDKDARGIDLNTNDVPFNHSLILSSEQSEATEPIFLECIEASKLTTYKVSARRESRTNFTTLMSNLFINERSHPIVVGLTEKWWVQTMYTQAGANTIKFIHILNNLNYIHLDRGFMNKDTGHSRLARIRATKKLLNACPVFPNGVLYNPVQVVIMKGRKPIMIDPNGVEKEGDRPYIEYNKFDKRARRTEKKVKRAIRVYQEANPRRGNEELSPYLHAIFTEKFEWGGRLYIRGHRHFVNHQHLSEEDRADITLNGEAVGELDYSGLHPRLLYAGEGIEYPLDNCPYGIIDSRPDVRTFLKMIFLPMINAVDWTSAETAANDWLWKFPRKDRKGNKKKRKVKPKHYTLQQRLIELGITSARPLMEKFMDVHNPIAHYLCNGVGVNESGVKNSLRRG